MVQGRHSEFKQEIADRICQELVKGFSLRAILRDNDDLPDASTIFKWLRVFPDFAHQYARAREAQADTLADEILAIADDGKNDTYIDADGKVRVDQDVIARSRLRVEARKWLAAKMAPKKYGDKVEVDHSGDVTIKQITRQIVDPLIISQNMSEVKEITDDNK